MTAAYDPRADWARHVILSSVLTSTTPLPHRPADLLVGRPDSPCWTVTQKV